MFPVKNEKRRTGFFGLNDRMIISGIIEGDEELAAVFLKRQCFKIFEYIKRTRLKELDLEVDDLINDFYIFLEEDNWEKLRSFRYESQLTTWINLVASRYFLKKYSDELKEISLKGTTIDNVNCFTDESDSIVRAELIEAIIRLKDKRQQQVLLMGLDGYEAAEIAELVGTSVNNVYVIKSRAIEKLKELLK